MKRRVTRARQDIEQMIAEIRMRGKAKLYKTTEADWRAYTGLIRRCLRAMRLEAKKNGIT